MHSISSQLSILQVGSSLLWNCICIRSPYRDVTSGEVRFTAPKLWNQNASINPYRHGTSVRGNQEPII